MRIQRSVVLGAAAALVTTTGAVAAGVVSPGQDGTITGCYNLVNGQVRVVSDKGRCKAESEGVLTWAQRGAKGDAGPAGPPGPKGDPGPAGKDGEDATIPDQACPAGEVVTGIAAGELVCTELPGGGGAPVDGDGDGVSPPQDCDDADAGVKPGREEVMGNDKDDDCDPGTPDRIASDGDGDGFSRFTDDCDDTDAQVNPGAAERPGNQQDDNCNGIVDERAGGGLVVNEIDRESSSDPSGPGDFVELLNTGTTPVDLANHVLVVVDEDTREETVTFLRSNAPLAAGQRHVVAERPFGVGGSVQQAREPLGPGQDGVVVGLFDGSERVDLTAAGLRFGQGQFGWFGQAHPYFEGPDAPGQSFDDGATRSVARLPDGRDTDRTADDWRPSHPTPGAANRATP